MSVRLTVKQRSEQGATDKPSVVLLDDAIITFGRDETCQVRLAQQAVSRSHARISRDGTLFFLEDLGSAYGTQINGSKLPKGEKHLLRNGDVIAIAQFDVTFDRVANATEESGKTEAVARKVVKDVMRGLATGGEQPYFRFMNGPREGQRIEIADASELVIGREPGVDLLFEEDDLISRRHVKIRRDWSGTHVEDLDSRNGIKINKKRARKKTLKDRDELEVGNQRLLYLDPSEVREAPVVLPAPEEEATSALDEDQSAEIEAAKAEAARINAEKEAAEAKAKEDAPKEDEAPPNTEQDGEGPPTDGEGVSGPTAQPEDVEGKSDPGSTAPESPSGEIDGPPSRVGVDFSNRTTQVALGVAGLVALVAITLVILVFAT
jgi:pSer/pThr/pTyr-binding forkhead associated (FHA) protein